MCIPRTKLQWIATLVGAALTVVFLLFFTQVFNGHAVEVSLQNQTNAVIFAYLDNTGRHGENTKVDTLSTDSGTSTPTGLTINAGSTRSFGYAVGFLDSPTFHILSVNSEGLAISEGVNDCPFDTYSLKEQKFPTFHVKLIWDGSACTRATHSAE